MLVKNNEWLLSEMKYMSVTINNICWYISSYLWLQHGRGYSACLIYLALCCVNKLSLSWSCILIYHLSYILCWSMLVEFIFHEEIIFIKTWNILILHFSTEVIPSAIFWVLNQWDFNLCRLCISFQYFYLLAGLQKLVLHLLWLCRTLHHGSQWNT